LLSYYYSSIVTLAYYENLSITDAKSFIRLVPGLDFLLDIFGLQGEDSAVLEGDVVLVVVVANERDLGVEEQVGARPSVEK